MTVADMIYQHVQTMPEAFAQEVLDFVQELKITWKNSSKTTPTESEPSSLRYLLDQCPLGSRTSQEIDKEFQALRDEWG